MTQLLETVNLVIHDPRSEQWLDGAHCPSDEDVKRRSRRQESHPLPGSLNTIREEKRENAVFISLPAWFLL